MNRTTEQELDQRPEEQPAGTAVKCPRCQAYVTTTAPHECRPVFRSWREAAEVQAMIPPIHADPGAWRRQQHPKADVERIRCRWCRAPAGEPCGPKPRREQDDRGICFPRIVDYAASDFDPTFIEQPPRGTP